MMKFICNGDKIISKNDEDIHEIGVNELCKLYGVNPKNTTQNTKGINYIWFELKAQYNGNYSLPDTIAEQCETRWKPLWEKNAIEKYSNMSFLQRLKFLFTKKV